MTSLLFLKLGGSLITDKTGVEVVREDVLRRVSAEIAAARAANPDLQLVLGHGSGSFGHVAGAKYGTRQGVDSAEDWRGFTEVGAAAARLNRRVVESLLEAGVPALRLPPSASALCEDGQIVSIAVEPIRRALAAGLVPVVFGDVAFDEVRGGTIVSTEEVMMAISAEMPPDWLLLAGETAGVLDLDQQVVARITEATLPAIAPALGGSRGTDVTGGMASKVRSMLDLVAAQPHMAIRIFSGLTPDNLTRVLADPTLPLGTELIDE